MKLKKKINSKKTSLTKKNFKKEKSFLNKTKRKAERKVKKEKELKKGIKKINKFLKRTTEAKTRKAKSKPLKTQKTSKRNLRRVRNLKSKKKLKKKKEVGRLRNAIFKKSERGMIAKENVDKNLTKEEKKDLQEVIFKPKIKVIGIGGGGCAIVSEISHSLKKSTFLLVDTDIRSLRKRGYLNHLLIGQEVTHGLGTGGNLNLAKQAAELSKEKINDILKNQDIIILIASLGGGVGSGATQVFAEIAQKNQGIIFGIFTLPFKFEGKTKSKIAYNSFKSLSKLLNVSLAISNEKIFKIIDPQTPITEAFSMVNKSLVQSLESLIDMIYTPGLINIDFADLKTILKGRGNIAFLNTVEKSGKDRAEKICKEILVNPLLKTSHFIPQKILFNISGSNNLSMLEVEKISNFIMSQNPQSKIIFGISQNPRLKNKIKVTLLMTGESKEDLVEKPLKETKKEESLKFRKKKIKKIPPKRKNSQIKEEKKEPIKEREILNLPVISLENSLIGVQGQETLSKKMTITETSYLPVKKVIRRTGLDIKKAEELEEEKRLAQEKEWEIPAFLRKTKFNK